MLINRIIKQLDMIYPKHKKGSVFTLALLTLLEMAPGTPLHAAESPLLKELQNKYKKSLYPRVLNGFDKGGASENISEIPCATGYIRSLTEPNQLQSYISNRSISIDTCIFKSLNQSLPAYVLGQIKGVAYGTTLGLSNGLGYSTGTELVVMQIDDKTIMAGLVKVKSVGLDISLPLGMSFSQSYIYGHCPEGVYSYLGLFEDISILGFGHHVGRESWIPFMGKNTGCNSMSVQIGSSTPIAGVSHSYYNLLGKFALIQGPRANDFIKELGLINQGYQF